MRILYINILMLLMVTSGFAQTKITIRAKAKDAKFIGSSIGGARIIVKDASSGKILDEGITSGSTGDTDQIMRKAHERYGQLTDDNTGKFVASLDITAPRFVEVEVIAPYNAKQAAIKASTQLWVIPGKDITGDGLVIEIPGFIVGVLSPQAHESLSSTGNIEIRANVVMMCGCTISKGGLWDADKITVNAIIRKDGEDYKTIPLKITDKVNTFATGLEKPSPGLYEISIYAFDERTGNTGVDKVNFIVK